MWESVHIVSAYSEFDFYVWEFSFFFTEYVLNPILGGVLFLFA